MNEEWILNKEQGLNKEQPESDYDTTKEEKVLTEENVTNEPVQESVTPGYYGGSYHSEWKSHQRQKSEAKPEVKSEVTSRYAKYNFDEEDDFFDDLEVTPKRRGMFKSVLKTAVCAVIFGVVAGSVMFGVNKLGNYFWEDEKEPIKQVSSVQLQTGNNAQDNTSKDENPTGNTNVGTAYTVSQVAESCMPSVVSITNATITSVKDYFGGTQKYENKSSGSGIIIGQNETELLIATNNHVIEGAETITIAFCDESVYQAQKKGSASDADLAVVAVRLSDMTKETLDAIRVIQIADAKDIKIGEQVVAIGNALGYGQSVTSGWVSALNRSVEDEDGNTADYLIQTDAAINPGNSGGALLNMRGELIGINSAKINSTLVEGMGYAISIEKAEPILNELMNLKTRYKVDPSKASYIGVSCQNVEASINQMYGIPVGAFVKEVVAEGPAEKAGMRRSDVIVKFDGQVIASASELVALLEYYEAGEIVEVVVARASEGGYKNVTLTVTLGKKNSN